MTNFHVVNEILHEITWNKSKKTVQKFIYINKIIPSSYKHDIRTRPYMVIRSYNDKLPIYINEYK